MVGRVAVRLMKPRSRRSALVHAAPRHVSHFALMTATRSHPTFLHIERQDTKQAIVLARLGDCGRLSKHLLGLGRFQ